MSTANENSCARTDAVLATHLDGDLSSGPRGDGRSGDEILEPGWSFVAEGTLPQHLRDCLVCQRALARARRLDAALAQASGLAVARHVARAKDMDQFADRMLQQAIGAATESATTPQATSALLDPSTSSSESQRAEPATTPDQYSKPWTLVAAAGLLAAGLATWLFLIKPTAERLWPTEPSPRQIASATPASDESEATRPDSQAARDLPEPDHSASHRSASHRSASHRSASHRSESADRAPLPIGMARRLHERGRELPEQATLTLAELTERIGDPRQPLAVRLAAGRRLVRNARPTSRRSRQAITDLLGCIAACGDTSRDDIALHEDLLEQLRSSSSIRSRLATRLTVHAGDRTLPTSRETFAAVIVAARVGSKRLDSALRRIMRRHPQLTEVVSSALRCGARSDGCAQLLLAGWQDQVALGNQAHTSTWASFWFREQPQQAFVELRKRHATSRSADERVRCLLAMGCIKDEATADTTIATLLTSLGDARRTEAHAAASALSNLPHHLLEPLIPAAMRADASLLRTSLARAGVPAAKPWLAQLSSQQRDLLHDVFDEDASLERFAAAVSLFRNTPNIAD